MYYYKLYYDHLSFLPLMTHPDFYIARKTPLDLTRNGTFKYLGHTLTKDAVYSINDVPAPLLLINEETHEYFTVNCETLATEYSVNTDNNITYQEKVLSDYVPFDPNNINHRSDYKDYTETGTQTTSLKFVDDYLVPEIKHRYAVNVTEPPLKARNIIIDSYVPKLFVDTRFVPEYLTGYTKNLEYRGNTPITISKFFSTFLSCNTLPFKDMVGMLGYSVEYLKDLYEKVSSKNFIMTFAGVGGTGINTLYWLNEIYKLAGNGNKLFSNINLFEKEEVEFSNLLRFPINSNLLNPRSHSNKLTLGVDLAIKIAYSYSSYNEYLVPNDHYGNIKYNQPVFTLANKLRSSERHIIYGAPDLITRDRLSSVGNFICATHADSSCSVWLNPSQDLNIQVESYGTIRLGTFFMNQLKMAIVLLEILSDDTVDFTEKDRHLLEYEFDAVNLPEATEELRNTYQFI